MVRPVDGIRAFHNAFRNDMRGIDSAALETARGREDIPSLERYRFFNEILVWHAHGEEVGVFPLIETAAPLVAEAYEKDHRGLDAAFGALDAAYARRDWLETARATAAFRFHLDMHLGKEDTHLYRIFDERVLRADQERALGVLAASIPPERFPEVMRWLFPLVGINDRENMVLILRANLPPAAFPGVRDLIRTAIGSGDWAELARRVPELEA